MDHQIFWWITKYFGGFDGMNELHIFFKKKNVKFKFYFTAVDQLEQSGIRTCMMKAVEAAAKRCQQLGA